MGTNAGRPTKDRNVTSIALRLLEPCEHIWLFDAGEGTQQQLLRTPLKLNKISKIFITHLHGDHIYGLPGLLTSRSYHEGAGPLMLFGPPGIKQLLDTIFELSGAYLNYELMVQEITDEGLLYEDVHFRVEVGSLDHRVPCFGYRVVEKEQSGMLNIEKLMQLGVPKGPLYGQLKRGENVWLEDGTEVLVAEVTAPPLPGRIITILGDTKPCDNAVKLAENADLLVHEATFRAGMEEKAHAYGHSTTIEAAETARRAGANRLLLTHYSSRFRMEELYQLQEEAAAYHPNTTAAYDLFSTTVPKRKRSSPH